MKTKPGFKSIPLSFNRKAVIASASVTSRICAIHSIAEIDVSEPRRLIREQEESTGVKLSFTGYLAACLSRTVKEFPEFNSFIRGNRLIIMDDLTVSVMVEREIRGEKVPEPVGIKKADEKSVMEITNELRAAQQPKEQGLGELSGLAWIRFIPRFLMETMVRIADRSIRMAARYGKVAVTSPGMFARGALWFIPHGSATVMLTVGSIHRMPVETEQGPEFREHLCITASFDHAVVDGAPAARFMDSFMGKVKSGDLISEAL